MLEWRGHTERPADGIPPVITFVCLEKTATYNVASKQNWEADVLKEMEKCQLQFRSYVGKRKYTN
jgi:hypothetical protein